MTKDEILVVKVNARFADRDMKEIRKIIMKQKSEGVVVLPYYCEAIIVPKDVKVEVESEKSDDSKK